MLRLSISAPNLRAQITNIDERPARRRSNRTMDGGRSRNRPMNRQTLKALHIVAYRLSNEQTNVENDGWVLEHDRVRKQALSTW